MGKVIPAELSHPELEFLIATINKSFLIFL